MPVSDGSLSRGYWVGLALALALAGPVILLNVLVNPIGIFGAPRQHVFNRTTPRPALEFVSGRRLTHFYDDVVADPQTNIFLVGDSRIGVGMPSCGLPIGRVIGLGWGLQTFDPVVRHLLTSRNRPATVLIQLPVLTEPEVLPTSSSATLMVYGALAPHATRLSLLTLQANAKRRFSDLGGREANCASQQAFGLEPAPITRTEQERRDYLHAGSNRYMHNLATLATLSAAADGVCARRHVRHRLVFFRLPASFEQSEDLRQMTVRASADAQRTIQARPTAASGCSISFVDFSSGPPGQEIRWRQPSNWIDQSHFGQALGASALSAILSMSDASDRWPPPPR